jgi:hypothetical protein
VKRIGIPKVLGAFTVAGILLPLGFALMGADKIIAPGLTLVAIGGTSVNPTPSHEEPKPEQPSAEFSRTAKKKPPDFQRREELATALEGDLRGAGDAFDDGKLRITPMVQIGTTESILELLPSSQLEPSFKPFPDAEFTVEFGRQWPVVSTTVRDSKGHIIATINKNHWRVYPPYCQEKNFTEDALEVLDSSLHVVLQLKLLPDRVQIQGEWWDNQGHGLRISRSPDPKRGQVTQLGPEIKRNDALIEPMFKYPSKQHWQEFVAN